MHKKDINNFDDIVLLTKQFYDQVKKHPELGPFFNETIKDWDAHLHQINLFWNTNIFLDFSYKGNPPQAHIDLDTKFNNTIEPAHFGFWLQLWFETVDTLFEGEKASMIKERARSMGHMLFLKIFEARQSKN